MIETDIAH